MSNLHYLNHNARLYHTTLDAVNDRVWLLVSNSFPVGIFTTEAGYGAFRALCGAAELGSHQVEVYRSESLAFFPKREFLGSLEMAQHFRTR